MPDKNIMLVKNFKARNIEACFYDSLFQAKDKILELIPADCTVGIGNSQTLKKMNISNLLGGRGNVTYDKTLGRNKKEITDLKKRSLLADWYLSGANAVSADGHIVSIDHSGNRVAAMLYGPDNVVIVVGKNKVVDTLEEAVNRARNIAAPLNAKRAGYNPPCVRLNKCVDCSSEERVCNSLVIIKGQESKDRMRLFIVNEDVGF